VKLLYILICFFIGIFFSPFLADAFFNKPEVESILRYGFFSGSLLSIFTSLSAWYQANSRFELVALCRPVFFFIILLALLLLISFDLRIKPGTLAGLYTLIAAGLSLLVLFKFFGQIKASNLTLFKSFPGFLKITWILLLSSLIELTASKLDIFVITKYVTFENIGIYGVAARLASIVGLVTGAINIVQLPKAASAVGNKLFISKYLKTSFLYLSIQTLFALALIMTLKPIVALTVGEDFLPSSDIAIILIFQVLFISYGGPFKDLIQCGPNPEMMVAVSCLKFVLATIFLLALIPRYGLAGAAYSVAISSFVITLITISLAFRQIYKNPCS
jgi:O-antigen/teichoic acid export membrane protein